MSAIAALDARARETVSRLERGELPHLRTACAIATALGADITIFVPVNEEARAGEFDFPRRRRRRRPGPRPRRPRPAGDREGDAMRAVAATMRERFEGFHGARTRSFFLHWASRLEQQAANRYSPSSRRRLLRSA